MALNLISTVTVGAGGASSIEFLGIPATGKDILIQYSLRSTTSTSTTVWTINSTTSGYFYYRLRGDGTGPEGLSGSEQFPMIVNRSSNTANAFALGSFYLTNYTANHNKLVSLDCTQGENAQSTNITMLSGQWANSATVSSIRIAVGTGIAQNSTASLYIVS